MKRVFTSMLLGGALALVLLPVGSRTARCEGGGGYEVYKNLKKVLHLCIVLTKGANFSQINSIVTPAMMELAGCGVATNLGVQYLDKSADSDDAAKQVCNKDEEDAGGTWDGSARAIALRITKPGGSSKRCNGFDVQYCADAMWDLGKYGTKLENWGYLGGMVASKQGGVAPATIDEDSFNAATFAGVLAASVGMAPGYGAADGFGYENKVQQGQKVSAKDGRAGWTKTGDAKNPGGCDIFLKNLPNNPEKEFGKGERVYQVIKDYPKYIAEPKNFGKEGLKWYMGSNAAPKDGAERIGGGAIGGGAQASTEAPPPSPAMAQASSGGGGGNGGGGGGGGESGGGGGGEGGLRGGGGGRTGGHDSPSGSTSLASAGGLSPGGRQYAEPSGATSDPGPQLNGNDRTRAIDTLTKELNKGIDSAVARGNGGGGSGGAGGTSTSNGTGATVGSPGYLTPGGSGTYSTATAQGSATTTSSDSTSVAVGTRNKPGEISSNPTFGAGDIPAYLRSRPKREGNPYENARVQGGRRTPGRTQQSGGYQEGSSGGDEGV